VDGWVGGWMDGWVDGWVGVKAVLRIAYSNKKNSEAQVSINICSNFFVQIIFNLTLSISVFNFPPFLFLQFFIFQKIPNYY
jgi:hypothetical protein